MPRAAHRLLELARGRSARTRRSAARPAASPRAGAAASRACRARRPRCPGGRSSAVRARAARRRAARTSRRRGPAPSAAASSACRPTSSAGRSTPSRSRWSTTACVRLTSRVSVASRRAFSSWNSGRTPAHTRSARASRKPGTSRSPSSSIWSTSSCVTGISSGSAARMSVVPITLTVRIGTRMSPSAGIVQRLTTVFTSRWFIAIMIPLPGITPMPSIPAMCTICAAHAPDALSVKPASMSSSSPVQLVAHARAGDRVAVAVQVDHAVVGEDARAVRGRAAGERPDRLPGVDRRVRDRERALDAGVQPRLAPQRLGDGDLLGRQRGPAAALEELVAVGRVVVGRGDEQPAGVLDAVRDDPAQDRVLGHALLGRDRVLDHVAPAGVQQAVEAPARALGEVGAVDEHDVEAAQRGVPGDAGAGRAAADHQDIGLSDGHDRPSYWPRDRPDSGGADASPLGQPRPRTSRRSA